MNKNNQTNVKYTTWKEIFMFLHNDFECLSDNQKNDFGKHIFEKLSSARDNWIKCARRMYSDSKSTIRSLGSIHQVDNSSNTVKREEGNHKLTTKDNNPTANHNTDKCGFCNKVPDRVPGLSAVNLSYNVNEPSSQHRGKGSKEVKQTETIKLPKRGTESQRVIQTRSRRNLSVSTNKYSVYDDDNKCMAFFKGIAPGLENFNENEFVEFQFEVVKALKNIVRKTQVKSRSTHFSGELSTKPSQPRVLPTNQEVPQTEVHTQTQNNNMMMQSIDIPQMPNYYPNRYYLHPPPPPPEGTAQNQNPPVVPYYLRHIPEGTMLNQIPPLIPYFFPDVIQNVPQSGYHMSRATSPIADDKGSHSFLKHVGSSSVPEFSINSASSASINERGTPNPHFDVFGDEGTNEIIIT